VGIVNVIAAIYSQLFIFLREGDLMKKQRFHLYHIDMKYIRDLARVDDNVMSVSPQIRKENRPFVGIVVICDNKKYCVPLTSPKSKHMSMKNDKDFSRMFDKGNKLIGCLNFNNMIPVDDSVLLPIDMRVHKSDSIGEQAYKALLNDQLDWCNDNLEAITSKACKLYKIVTETPDKMKNLTRRCCDFKKLEQVLEKRKNSKCF
jgi:protein AbiQ